MTSGHGRKSVAAGYSLAWKVLGFLFNAEAAHLGKQCGSGDPQARRGSPPSSNNAVCFLQNLKNMVARSVLERFSILGKAGFPALQLAQRWSKDGAFRNNHSMLNKILELADVSGPVIG